jgi:hypothetical protein
MCTDERCNHPHTCECDEQCSGQHYEDRRLRDYFTSLYTEYGRLSHLKGALYMYLVRGIPTGDFLRCVLSNDLKGSISHADSRNLQNIPALVKLLYNHFPIDSWGSEGYYVSWRKRAFESCQKEGEERMCEIIGPVSLWLKGEE